MIAIDDAWRTAHPLPEIRPGLDKEARGRVLLVGGSVSVPGAVLLTGEAILRAGAGKVQIGTVDCAALAIGTAFPEAAVVGLPMNGDGELAADGAARLTDFAACDALLVGPAMACRPHTGALLRELLELVGPDVAVVLDAGAITALRDCRQRIGKRAAPMVLTPHHGELASLMDIDKDIVGRDPAAAAADAAKAFDAIVVLKAAETFIADPHGGLCSFACDALGLGTAGSGDVLSGIIAGLLARGADPIVAAGHGLWVHGQAGCAAEAEIGSIGYLARDLLRFIPGLVSHGFSRVEA